jgi:hypothetical protein
MKIDEKYEKDYETVKVAEIGLVDLLTGALVFKSDSRNKISNQLTINQISYSIWRMIN